MSTSQNATRGGSLRPREPTDNLPDRPGEDSREATLDETIDDTFPASDPPSTIPDPEKPRPSRTRLKGRR